MSSVEKNVLHKVSTSDARSVWQEVFDRVSPVRSESVQMAQELFRKYRGSWAGLYSIDGATKSNNLGQRGFGEVNFRPYDFRTSSANKAPSLIGHPVSFEVVGPTLKSRSNDWQWLVTDNFGNVGTGDVLTLDTISANQSPLGAPTVSAFTSIEDIYGLTVATPPAEGLYLVVSETGSEGYNGVTPSGLGDGTYGDTAPSTQVAISPLKEDSRFEVFRIQSFTATALTLDPNKRLADYFDLSVGVVLRAVTILRPIAARMALVPQSGGKVYAFLPPERGLVGDHRPPYTVWSTATPSPEINWSGDTVTSGNAFYGSSNYLTGAYTPNPKPLSFGQAHAVGEVGDAAHIPGNLGSLSIKVDSSTSSLSVGRLVHIYDVASIGATEASFFGGGDILEDPGLGSLKGWYRIATVSNASGHLVLDSQPTVDPVTGVLFDPPPDTYILRSGERIQILFTVHDQVRETWTSRSVSLKDIASARLSNLIDPNWDVSSTSSMKAGSAYRVPSGTSKGHGRAAFDTAAPNPGSLNDLGFEVVLYPATVHPVTGYCVADFSRPINPRNVVLDSNTAATQSITVDYASGVCYLSHTPVQNASCEVCPDGNTLLTPDNPRSEIVLFASFVPYSMDEGQSSVAGVRVSGVYSDSLKYTLYPQTITIPARPNKFTVDVIDYLQGFELPRTGFFDLVGPDGKTPLFTFAATTPTVPANTFAYYKYEYLGLYTRFYCYGGGDDAATVTVHGNSGSNGYMVIRRDVVLPARNDTNDVGVRADQDSTYGFAAVASKLSFANSRSERDSVSGEVTVTNEQSESHAAFLDEAFTTALISGAAVTTNGADRSISIAEGVYLIQGKRVVFPAQQIPESVGAFGANTTHYLQLIGLDSSAPYYEVKTTPRRSALNDLPLAQITTNGAVVTSIIPLTLPLVSVDRRLTVYVGPQEVAGDGFPHFTTLAEAVSFAGSLMDPVTGNDGLYLTINVVGTTTETATPIVLSQVSGITIQGSLGPVNGGGAGNTHGIHWATNAALFDVSNTTAVTIRDLKFVYSSAPAVRANADRGLFVNPNGDAYYLHVSNVDFNGSSKAHFVGLFENNVNNSVFRDVRVSAVTDAGFRHTLRHTLTTTAFFECLFDSCDIRIQGSAQTADVADAVISLRSNDAVRNVIRNCKLSGSDYGVIVGGSYNHVEGCSIRDTSFYGVWSKDTVANCHNKITDNWITNVNTSAARPSYGVLIDDGDRTTFSGNTVRLNTDNTALDADTDCALASTAGVDYCNIKDNDFDWSVSLNGSYNRLESCFVSNGVVSVSDSGAGLGGCIIKGNTLQLGFIELAFSATRSVVCENILPNDVGGARNSAITVSSTNTVVSNNVIGAGVDIKASADSCIVAGNVLNSASPSLCDLEVHGSSVTLVGNYILNDLVLVSSEDTYIGNSVGNDILLKGSSMVGVGNVVTRNITSSLFTGSTIAHGNLVQGDVSIAHGTVNLQNTLFSGNHAYGSVSLKNKVIATSNAVDSLSVATSTNSVVSGNVTLSGGITMSDSVNPIIAGNHVATDITVNNVDPGTFVVTGNQAVKVTCAGGTEPDSAPYNSIVVGNRFTDATPVFAVAADSTGRTANVRKA